MALTSTITGWSGGTLDLNDHTNFSVARNGLSPVVSQRKKGLMGGPLYQDVIQPITLFAYGASASAAAENLEKLTAALDQAERWSRRENVDAVIWNFQPEGSGLGSALKYVILGPADTQDWLQLPARFNQDLQAYVIGPFTLQFRRRGRGLGPTESQTAAGSINAGAKTSVTFSNTARLPSPVIIELAESTESGYAVDGFILVADDADKIQFAEAGTDLLGTGANGNWTLENESSNQASSTNVYRYTPSSPGEDDMTGLSVTVTDRILAVFANIRNNQTDAEWLVTLEASGPGMSNVRSRPAIIDGSSTNPRWVALGTIYSRQGVDNIDIFVQPDDDTGSPTIDFDQIVLLGIDDPATCRAIKYDSVIEGVTGLSGSTKILIDPRALDDVQPFVGGSDASNERPSGTYEGDAYIMSSGTEFAVAPLLRNGQYWRTYLSAALVDYTLTAKRRIAYAAPR